jgi:NTE family protein
MSNNTAPSATPHALDKYTRRTAKQDFGLALCLSGGGYRAALFHLGALRRLNELGILSQVATISSVSGGSILNGLLAENALPWPEPGTAISEWDRRIAGPLRWFTQRNIRTRAVVHRLLPWNWLDRDAGVQALARQYRRLIRRRLDGLPERPRFIFCATDIIFGVNWVFDTGGTRVPGGRFGSYQAGYFSPLPRAPMALAVAASSCFPPVFNPMLLGLTPERLRGGKYTKLDRDDLISTIGLSDGGVYDNFGLEPVWKNHRRLLVSDGGGVFKGETDAGLIWRVQRYAAIQGHQVSRLRKRWLITNFIQGELTGAYWGIGSSADHYQFGGEFYSEGLVDGFISEVRTDLDAFSEAEQSVLENHGYIMAEAAIRRHAADLVAIETPFAIPHPEWMEKSCVEEALCHSHKRTFLGRS